MRDVSSTSFSSPNSPTFRPGLERVLGSIFDRSFVMTCFILVLAIFATFSAYQLTIAMSTSPFPRSVKAPAGNRGYQHEWKLGGVALPSLRMQPGRCCGAGKWRECRRCRKLDFHIPLSSLAKEILIEMISDDRNRILHWSDWYAELIRTLERILT
jgi:hypothetical protein